jgi:eukaryotic-like serine/threonine-protein kinase
MPHESEDTDFHLLGIPSEEDSHDLRSRVPFELLASQFVDELRTGKGPSVELYAKRYPPHAGKIRDVFPVLAMLEDARIEKEAQSIRRNMPDRFPFTRLGNCELLSELGRGGMGVVYQARDLQSGHLVAVKILPWRVSIVPEWVERFEREARIAAQLRHRNIVPVFRYGQEDGYCYFVMQFVNGIGLDRIISRLRESDGTISVDEIRLQVTENSRGLSAVPKTPVAREANLVPEGKSLPQSKPQQQGSSSSGVVLNESAELDHQPRRRLTRTSWPNFIKIAIQATQALRAAHAAGILHNDIKPGNLLLDGEGRVWVSDFGLSQPITPVGAKSVDRTIAGTLRYMAPERLMGQQSASCDIYSLGATLYELCLQRPVFDHADRDELVRMVMEDSPVRPRDICREIPRGLETVILNCLAKHPPDRYPTADAMLTDLLRCSKDQSVGSTYRRSLSGFYHALRNRLRRRRPV